MDISSYICHLIETLFYTQESLLIFFGVFVMSQLWPVNIIGQRYFSSEAKVQYLVSNIDIRILIRVILLFLYYLPNKKS